MRSRTDFFNPPMLMVSAARRRLPSPVGLPLAGFLRRAQSGLPCKAEDGTLEINAVAFQDGNQAALLIAIDTLIAGPDLTTAAAALARDSFGDEAVALVAASHTHFAPATDPTRPMLGEMTAAYAEGVHTALQQVVEELRAVGTGAMLGLASRIANGNVHRRRRWPFPTLLWWVHSRIEPIIMAPNRKGPRDPRVRVAVLRAPGGAPIAIVWNYACHPVFYPRERAATAEFVGYVRSVVRTHFRHPDLPVIFLQGFAGDVCPDIRPDRSLRTLGETLVLGPRWGRFTPESWTAWADGIAQAVLAAIEAAPVNPLEGSLHVESCGIDLKELVDGNLPQRRLALDCLDIGSRWSMIALSAEPSSAYAELLGLGPAWPVSCTGDVYGYLPTEAQRRAGGYEADGYFAALGLQARLRPDGERRVVEACRTTFGKRP
jgi:hypothetical protein